LIERTNPEVKVTGSEYPPSSERQLIATIIYIIQYAFMALCCFGETLFGLFRLPVEAFKPIQESRWTYLIGAIFVGNQLRAACTQTGAFEIYVDNTLIFSKLESGRIFSQEELYMLFLENGIALK